MTKCPNCGDTEYLYAKLDTKWDPVKQCWIIIPESVLDGPAECTACDATFDLEEADND